MQVRYGDGISGVLMNVYYPLFIVMGILPLWDSRRKDRIRKLLVVDQYGFLMADANV